jgi:capsular polysaccharide biosynthesis protein
MIFVLGAMLLKEQTELLARAKLVIGLHGAGLSNFAFVRPGTLVV